MNYTKKFEASDNITLYLGDCNLILPELDIKFDAVITDPPYGISYRSNKRVKTEKFDKIENDGEPDGAWLNNLNCIVNDTACLFMFSRWDVEHAWREFAVASGWDVKNQIIWYKPGGGIGDLKAQFMPVHENAIFAVRGVWSFPAKRPASVYRFTKDDVNSYIHPTQKPVALMERILLDITYKNSCVIDPFMGSGTTGIACAKHGRPFVGVEIDERYFDFACERISQALMQPRLI